MSARARGAALLAAMVTTLARQGGAQRPPEWSIAVEPSVSIDGLSSDSVFELRWAESAIRLANGEIVIANRGSWELRWFDASGRHLRTLGRRGQGPREFGRSTYVFGISGDTVAVHDADNRRSHYLSAGGEFVRMDTAGARNRDVWVFDRTVVERLPANADLARLRRVLLRIPHAPRDTIRSALVDRAGNAWVRGASAPQSFVIYNGDARAIGMLTLPPRFEIYQVLDSLVLGRFRDADDAEQIQVRRLVSPRMSSPTQAPGRAREPYDEMAELRAHSGVVRSMRSAGRNLLTAQELFYARHKRYARSLSELGSTVPGMAPEVRRAIVAGSDRSYWVISEHPSTRVVCVVGIGAGVPFGDVERCG